MTNPRNPDSVAFAVLEAIRLIGAETCSKVIGRGAQTIRDYSDETRPGNITLEHAMALDQACHEKAGVRPFLRLACLRAGLEPPAGEIPAHRFRYEIVPHRSRFVVVDNRSDDPAPVFQTMRAAEDWVAAQRERAA